MRWITAAFFSLALMTLPVWAGKVRFFRHHQPADYQKAVFKNTVLASDGSIRLARPVNMVSGLEAAYVWCIAEDPQGQLYVGTGNEGKIFRVDGSGRVSLFYKSEEPHIFSLAALPGGRIVAGTGPGGLILDIAPDGKAKVLTKTGENYVWSLVSDPDRDVLYAGTGPHGKILSIKRDGQTELLYATNQEHVQALLLNQNRLYAATGKRGLVVRVDLDTKQPAVVFEAPPGEIRSLCQVDKTIFAGTATPLDQTGAASSGTDSAASKSGSGGPTVKENIVYALAPDGTVREIFRNQAMILALAGVQDRLLIATGGNGQLFEYDLREGLCSQLLRLESKQIPALCRRKDGAVVVGSGDPGRVYILQPGYARQGTLVSEALDARQISRFLRVQWLATVPPGTQLTIALRSGNTAFPDQTWSPWSEPITDPEQACPAVPPARYVQYRLTLSTDQPQTTPILHSLALGYQQVNLAPEVLAIEVPDLEATSAEPSKGPANRLLRFKWTASDPNDDPLVYDVFLRKEGWAHWVQLAHDLKKPELEWDCTTVPSGIYRLKVVASDRRENAPQESRQTERISAPFVVDNVAPQVTVQFEKWDGDMAWITANASDNLTRLAQAAWSLDGGKWQPLFPSDGVFNKQSKQFRFRVGPLAAGTHVVLVRVSDAAGNTGAGDLVFEK